MSRLVKMRRLAVRALVALTVSWPKKHARVPWAPGSFALRRTNVSENAIRHRGHCLNHQASNLLAAPRMMLRIRLTCLASSKLSAKISGFAT